MVKTWRIWQHHVPTLSGFRPYSERDLRHASRAQIGLTN